MKKIFPSPEYYLDEDSIYEAIDNHTMFNLLDIQNGDKVDFWILTNDPFDQSRFSRRYLEEFTGVELKISRPEDTILAKLRCAKLADGSEKQFTDAMRVYEVQFKNIDYNYLNIWARELKIELLLKQMKDKAEIP